MLRGRCVPTLLAIYSSLHSLGRHSCDCRYFPVEVSNPAIGRQQPKLRLKPLEFPADHARTGLPGDLRGSFGMAYELIEVAALQAQHGEVCKHIRAAPCREVSTKSVCQGLLCQVRTSKCHIARPLF